MSRCFSTKFQRVLRGQHWLVATLTGCPEIRWNSLWYSVGKIGIILNSFCQVLSRRYPVCVFWHSTARQIAFHSCLSFNVVACSPIILGYFLVSWNLTSPLWMFEGFTLWCWRFATWKGIFSACCDHTWNALVVSPLLRKVWNSAGMESGKMSLSDAGCVSSGRGATGRCVRRICIALGIVRYILIIEWLVEQAVLMTSYPCTKSMEFLYAKIWSMREPLPWWQVGFQRMLSGAEQLASIIGPFACQDCRIELSSVARLKSPRISATTSPFSQRSCWTALKQSCAYFLFDASHLAPLGRYKF